MVRYDGWKFAEEPFPEAFERGIELGKRYLADTRWGDTEAKADALVREERKNYLRRLPPFTEGLPPPPPGRNIGLLFDQEILGSMIVAIAVLYGKDPMETLLHRQINDWIFAWSQKKEEEEGNPFPSLKHLPIFGTVIGGVERMREWNYWAEYARRTFREGH